MPTAPEPNPAGRRERNKSDKQQRIFDAADALFAEHGYAAVTTQQIAERADVAAGTVFRYALSKSELLLMVHNQRYRRALEYAELHLPPAGQVAERLAALLTPIVHFGRLNDENTAAYGQAMLFGSSHEPYRTEALQLMDRLQQRVAEVLATGWALQHAGSPGQPALPAPDAAPAARAIYAVLLFASIQATHTDVSVEHELAGILSQVDVISRGYLHPAPAHNATSASELHDSV
ncbi:TetR/AcrR family transcriptional regulator [Microterricola pindariensis]|uniref:HTH tetR-type domain-containing protein n=1 Tax=Microterricola pindariensis TaxID=478010 RepID=A0ABX5AYV3_9MICO|nr:TetR/AcrR family transcriptional regulator [Microterricola pindariensis]PPL19569.1 hypothetical protein GY24_05120 [Microterricola pindariensis]